MIKGVGRDVVPRREGERVGVGRVRETMGHSTSQTHQRKNKQGERGKGRGKKSGELESGQEGHRVASGCRGREASGATKMGEQEGIT
jgi:hypothetical protein